MGRTLSTQDGTGTKEDMSRYVVRCGCERPNSAVAESVQHVFVAFIASVQAPSSFFTMGTMRLRGEYCIGIASLLS